MIVPKFKSRINRVRSEADIWSDNGTKHIKIQIGLGKIKLYTGDISRKSAFFEIEVGKREDNIYQNEIIWPIDK